MATISRGVYPPWVTAKVIDHGLTILITVKYGVFEQSFEVPRGETNYDTDRIAYQLYLSLKDKQARLDAVTAKIIKR
jgi:hypothetical protein